MTHPHQVARDLIAWAEKMEGATRLRTAKQRETARRLALSLRRGASTIVGLLHEAENQPDAPEDRP